MSEFVITLTQFAAFGISFSISLKLLPATIRFGHEKKLLDIPHDRKKHAAPTPYLGGSLLFVVFWSIFLLFCFACLLLPETLVIHKRLLFLMQKQIPGVFLGSLLITTVGFLDDRYDVSPAVKFFAQAAAAGILLSIGLSVNFLEGLGLLGYFVTFLWIMMIMNAFNFIDSIDGHCIGVSLVSCLVFYAISLIVFQPVLGVMVMTLGGSLAALLRFNWKPAKIFLGDTGSLFLGYMMASLTLLYTYRSSQYSIVTPFIPILMFGVPIYDTVSVIAVRLYRGIPPWKGDRNHFAHRLVKLGMSVKIAVVVSYFISFTLGLVAILSTQVHTFLGKLLIVLIFISIMGIITLFEYYAAMHIRRMERIALRRKSIPPNPSE